MKRITLVITLIFNALQIGFSCRCQPSDKTFCDELQSIGKNQIVARVLIEKREGASAEARILNLYKGDEDRKNIRIWGSDGINCNNGLGRVGDVFIAVLGRYERVIVSSKLIEIGDYDSGINCRNTLLWVDNGKIKGAINQLKDEEIEDIDPSKLLFCPSFQTNEEELQNIQILLNPTSNDMILKDLKSDITIDIFDIAGRHLLAKTVSVSSNIVSFGNFASGLYIIRLRRNTIVRGLKFVKI
jgi:hypothetical protein